ncbi:SOS response-associated peptidase family protein [Roseateles chitinivorans]|uniref:SOS response-associated peptidase family protein n=1 Tax=Roseateles chitinivorans TaxID=2917965 RepID=UPI003D665C80
MCYSARIRQEWKTFCARLGVKISLADYIELFWERADGRKLSIPKTMEAMFTDPRTGDEQRAWDAVVRYRESRTAEVEQELFDLRRRVADAERKLAAKPTKAAEDSRRIATNKIEQRLRWLGDLRRDLPTEEQDSRIYPGWYVPVIVMENGERVLKPMRYQCRPAGKPAFFDTKFPGTYNARRDSLSGFWRGEFGVSHGVMVAEAFFEVVERDGKKVVLEFRPQGMGDMLVACLWSRWESSEASGEPPLLSFAAITDDPPPEIAATGHDRCVIPIKASHLDAWLDPRGDLDAMQRLLDDRERPFFEHRLAA